MQEGVEGKEEQNQKMVESGRHLWSLASPTPSVRGHSSRLLRECPVRSEIPPEMETPHSLDNLLHVQTLL